MHLPCFAEHGNATYFPVEYFYILSSTLIAAINCNYPQIIDLTDYHGQILLNFIIHVDSRAQYLEYVRH